MSSENQGKPGVQRTVLIVDDHPLLRDAISLLVAQDQGLRVCGEAASYQEAVRKLEELKPDLALVDIGLNDVSGIELVREISRSHPETLSIVLSMFDEFSYAPKALQAGAKGYIMKTEPPQTVLQGIRCVFEGKTFVSDSVKEWLVSSLSGSQKGPSDEVVISRALSKRELQVFSLIGSGLTTKAISKKLHISPKTVQTHREKIKSKLKLKTSADLGHSAFMWLHSGRKDA